MTVEQMIDYLRFWIAARCADMSHMPKAPPPNPAFGR